MTVGQALTEPDGCLQVAGEHSVVTAAATYPVSCIRAVCSEARLAHGCAVSCKAEHLIRRRAERRCHNGLRAAEHDVGPRDQSSAHEQVLRRADRGCTDHVSGSDRVAVGDPLVAGLPLGDEPSGRPTKLEWSITLVRPRGSSLTSEVGGSDSLSTY